MPMAAFAVYAFARPEVNRQLEWLIPSEDTTITEDSKSFSREYFDSRLDAFYKQKYGNVTLSRIEKFDRLKEQFRVVAVLINSEDKIMVDNSILSIGEFQATVESIMTTRKQYDKPILLYFLNDIGTSKQYVERASTVLGATIEKHSSTTSPILVYWATKMRKYGEWQTTSHSQTERDVHVRIIDKNNKDYLVYINIYDTYDAIKKKFNIFLLN